jgi:hypothetical protein
MDSFPFENNFGASMDNSIDLEDKDFDDAINGNFLPFVDLEEAINDLDDVINSNFLPFNYLEEAINNDFFLFFGASMTIIFVSLSSTHESWTLATFDCDDDDDFASTNDFAGDTIAAVRPPLPSFVVLNLLFPSNAILPGDFTQDDQGDFFSFLLCDEFTSASLFIMRFCGFVPWR